MAARKFKFVSPGVFLKEIDNSQLPKLPGNIGPVIIGRARRGPAMNPVKVNSYAEFVEAFGEPIPGNQGDDPWREGNGLLAPAYAGYAAKAYLASDIQSPVTMVRLLGVEGDNATDQGAAGWKASSAYALVTYPSGSITGSAHNVSAIFYTIGDTKIQALGTIPNRVTTYTADSPAPSGSVVKTDETGAFEILVDNASTKKVFKVDFAKGSKNYIRSVLNTNPVMTNDLVASVVSGTMAADFWLGETFDDVIPSTAVKYGYILKLQNEALYNLADLELPATAARSGWVFCQDEGRKEDFDPLSQDRLFRFISLSEGEESSKDIIVAIEDLRIPQEGDTDPYGSFTVLVKRIYGTRVEVVESFVDCNLNPNSDRYIGRQIGDQYFQWSSTEKRNKVYGNYINNSKYVRVDIETNVDQGNLSPSKVPFGFYGPIVPADIKLSITGGTLTAASNVGSADAFIDQLQPLSSSNDGGIDNGSGTWTISWPKLPLTVSGSVRGDDYFGDAVYKLSSNELTSEVNDGRIDYIRRLPTGLAAQQISGLATGNKGQYTYTFSLDDIVLSGTLGPDAATTNVKEAVYVSGSRAIQQATATVKFVTSNAVQLDGDNISITLQAVDGTSRTYRFNNGGGQANGALIPDTTDVIRVNVGGENTQGGFATKLKEAIEATAGHNGKLEATLSTVTNANDTVTIKQKTFGASGNTTIPAIPNGATGKFTVNGDVTQTTFTGGVGSTTGLASYTALSSSTALLELGFDKFQMPLVGGSDGVNIREADPFANRVLLNGTTANNYAFASVDRALELIKDPEVIEHNLACMPGITNDALTLKLVEKCESRADSLAVIDLKDVYLPAHEKKCDSFADRIATTPQAAAKALKARQLNSSYGATYYPWVKVRDNENSRDVWVPPSVVALGVMAYTEQRDEVWFAPAGFNRGGLNEGNAGIPVLQVSEQLLSKQRDTLYEASINPIASFVTEGLVIFGQKTLQTTPSALDRINVRRLLIFVKKEISRIASSLLFDQNVPATWNRFLGQVNPFLQSVQTRLGLSDYKVILDNTTTTPDLVDRNVLYAKIFLKPARSIEFIAVDFVITNTGASFDD